jgi:hypothetical protein
MTHVRLGFIKLEIFLLIMSNETPGVTSDSGMSRICVRMPRAQRKKLEKLVENGTFPNESEAIRHAIRKQISNQTTETTYM